MEYIDIIRKIYEDEILQCNACGKEIEPGELVNEFREVGDEDVDIFCMKCLAHMVLEVPNPQWKRTEETADSEYEKIIKD